jgi:carboxypeptidase C (cathepsin A)
MLASAMPVSLDSAIRSTDRKSGQVSSGLLHRLVTRAARWTITEDARWVCWKPDLTVNGKLTNTRHIEVNPEHNGNLFFWHYQNRHIANKQRTVIWLNGGPGCSSMDGALMEIGPYRLKDDEHLMYNEGSWDEFANLLFVDNPVGTGFSYVDTDSFLHELSEMADHFITFMEKWFAIFPQYEHDDVSTSSPGEVS